jgi:hypothetical protein
VDGAALHLVLTLVGLLCVEFTLMPVTDWLLAHWLVTPSCPDPILARFIRAIQ